VAMLVTPKSQREKPRKAEVTEARWSIQVGAYATRKATERAIQQAVKRAPELLKHATAIISPLSQKRGMLYRGRLSGLEASDARKASAVGVPASQSGNWSRYHWLAGLPASPVTTLMVV